MCKNVASVIRPLRADGLPRGYSGAIARSYESLVCIMPRWSPVTYFRSLFLVSTALMALMTVSAHAETVMAAPEMPAPAPQEVDLDKGADFGADRISYDKDKDIVTADGRVQMVHQGYRLRAESVIYNRMTGEVSASGKVSITSPGGDVSYGDAVKLSDTLKEGVVENILVVLEDGGRLAAVHGERKGNELHMLKATYSPCAVVDDHNCPKRPAWLIWAKRISYDAKTKKVHYHDAHVEVFGVPIVPLPYFWHTTSDQPSTGLLSPLIDVSSNNGLSIGLPLHVHLTNQNDLTVTPFLFSASPPALEGAYRQLTKSGAFSITAFVTDSLVTPIDVKNGITKEMFRGYFDATGRYQLDPQWNIHGSLRIETDRTLLPNYNLSLDDRLRSNLTAERIGPTTYLSIASWGTETARPLESQAQMPIALPEVGYRKRYEDSLGGGTLMLQANTLALSRTTGQQTQRAFTGFEWDLRKRTSFGQELIFTAYGRGDIYHSASNTQNPTAFYQGQTGWQTRAIGAFAAEARWPFIGEGYGGTIRFTPRVQFVVSPPTANLTMPNEDARAIELDDTNLFALNRFAGYDRWEDGTRMTYGADWSLDRPGLSINTNIGQSYRLTALSNALIFPTGTGLADRFSDVVGRTTVRYRSLITLTHRYRIDKNSFSVHRNELDLTVGNSKTYAIISYLKLNRNLSTTLEDLRNHEEMRIGGRVQINKKWSVYGSTIVDLTTTKLDPTSTTNGYSPVRQRLGAAYEDDCIKLDLSWRRDFNNIYGGQTGSVFQFRVAFKNLGR